MSKSNFKIVQIASSENQNVLSKSKKLFNKLIKLIDTKKKELVEWQEIIPIYQEKYSREFLPLLDKLNEYKESYVYTLDEAYESKTFNKKDRKIMDDIICSIASDLIYDIENEKLKEIYNKYSGGDFDSEKQDSIDRMREMMEDMIGFDIEGDIDPSSPETLFQELNEKMQQKLSEEEKRPKRKKSAKALAKEAEKEKIEQEVSQSIRTVYYKLANSLHPDRELDHTERERKTALMQRLNVAYKNKDLLTLLELQLEVEQIDESAINSMNEEKVAHYNKILNDQLSELKEEISHIKYAFEFKFQIIFLLSPRQIIDKLNHDIIGIQGEIKNISNDLELFKDTKNIKSFLRNL